MAKEQEPPRSLRPEPNQLPLPNFKLPSTERAYISWLVERKVMIQRHINELIDEEEKVTNQIKALMQRRIEQGLDSPPKGDVKKE